MVSDNQNKRVEEMHNMIFSVLPRRLSWEILHTVGKRRDFPEGLSEIRVRRGARSSVVISGENVSLFTAVSETDMNTLYDKALGGALYAHKDEVERGFISMPYGVRVGISASKRDWGALPLEVSSLVFRLPGARSETAGGIFELWRKEKPNGMLIYSAPGGGKTSAIRSLSGMICRECAVRVAVIDERREFSAEDYSDCALDVLSGYKKAEGIEIAMRTLSPEVMIIDEIGSEREAESLLAVGRGGIPIIATAHAENLSEALRRRCISELHKNGYLDLFVRLKREKNRFSFAREV